MLDCKWCNLKKEEHSTHLLIKETGNSSLDKIACGISVKSIKKCEYVCQRSKVSCKLCKAASSIISPRAIISPILKKFDMNELVYHTKLLYMKELRPRISSVKNPFGEYMIIKQGYPWPQASVKTIPDEYVKDAISNGNIILETKRGSVWSYYAMVGLHTNANLHCLRNLMPRDF
jgi:hypothetical protein